MLDPLFIRLLGIYFFYFFQECSIFYSKRFCHPCVMDNLQEFPVEVQMVR